MPRPRKDDTRKHQINIRFTAREFARVHHHAGLLGKTPADFARSVMLRRPRRRKGKAPVMIAIGERILRRWHETGSALNAVAHRFNATGEIPGIELDSAASRAAPSRWEPAFPLLSWRAAAAPPTRWRPRSAITCARPAPTSSRSPTAFQALGLLPPLPLFNLIRRFRTILNGDSPPHGA